mmetsp:Transcript_7140/g.9674  ORF Transcript_7140/g.9674 Transcript_7140/m.9674 type:complete len:556 (+) Transcript_7140:194-1861(+)
MSPIWKLSIMVAVTIAMLDLLSDLTMSKSYLRILVGEGLHGYYRDYGYEVGETISEEMKYVYEEEIFDSHQEATHNFAQNTGVRDLWHEDNPWGIHAEEYDNHDHEAISQEALRRLRLLSDPTHQVTRRLKYMVLGHPTSIIRYGVYDPQYSYPFLLSKNHATEATRSVTRVADGLSGPKYVSVCTESLIKEALGKDGHFDVIVLDYFSKAIDGLYELAGRLRHRYPDAIIIILRLWKPVHINWMKKGERRGSLRDWGLHLSEKYGRTIRYGTEEWFEHLNKTSLKLEWQDFTERDGVVHAIEQDFGAKTFRLEMERDDPKLTLAQHHELFYPDYTHVSVLGHRHLYYAIMEFVREGLRTYPKVGHVTAGDWGAGDSCHSWYLSGKLPTDNHIEGLKMEEFRLSHSLSSHFVHGASTGVQRPNKSGWMRIHNPFSGDRNLIISYMAIGPAPCQYPLTEITVYDLQSNLISKVTANPCTNKHGRQVVHTINTLMVGSIPPGYVNLRWSRLSEPVGAPALPFRLTAVQVVGEDVYEGGVLGPIAYFDSIGQFGDYDR